MSEKKEEVQKGQSKILSPNPAVKKLNAEILHAFGQRKVSLADMTRLSPKKIKQIADMGYTKLKHGRNQEAQKIFEVLTFVDHQNFFYHLALGSAYQKQKKYLDAVFQYSECIKLKPGHLNALVNRGELYLRKKNYRMAAEDFREAILADTTGKDKFANRARSLVIAIKRSLAKDKQLASTPNKKSLPSKKKTISPFKAVRKTKK